MCVIDLDEPTKQIVMKSIFLILGLIAGQALFSQITFRVIADINGRPLDSVYNDSISVRLFHEELFWRNPPTDPVETRLARTGQEVKWETISTGTTCVDYVAEDWGTYHMVFENRFTGEVLAYFMAHVGRYSRFCTDHGKVIHTMRPKHPLLSMGGQWAPEYGNVVKGFYPPGIQ